MTVAMSLLSSPLARAEWVYKTTDVSSADKWVYVTNDPSSADKWVYVTNDPSSADPKGCLDK